jgi:hypothetical protein
MAFNFWKSDKDNVVGGEDQPLVADGGGVERAARFLRHPRVAGTSRANKVAFLESKGCAPADIDEALRLVEDDKDMSWAAGLEDDKKGLAPLATDGPFEETAVSARGGGGYDDLGGGRASDEDIYYDVERSGGKKKKKKASKGPRRGRSDAALDRRRYHRNVCACLCCTVFVTFPTVAFLFHYFDLVDNVTTIVRCLHTRC